MNNRDVALIGMGCPTLMGIDGLGIIVPNITLPPATVPWYQKVGNFFTKVETGVNTLTPVAQQGKGLFDLFKSTKSNVLNPPVNASTPPPPAATGNNTAKIALGVAAVAGIALIAIKMHQGSKKKKALGEVTEDVSHEVIEPAAVLNGTNKKSRKRKAKSRK